MRIRALSPIRKRLRKNLRRIRKKVTRARDSLLGREATKSKDRTERPVVAPVVEPPPIRVEATPPASTEAATQIVERSHPVAPGYVDKGTQILLGLRYRELAEAGRVLSFRDVEFRNNSQTGEDGILHYVMSVVGTTNRVVVEMCAGNGIECNSTNLIVNHGWTGVLFDGHAPNVAQARKFFSTHPDTWSLPPRIVQAWINAENVNELLEKEGLSGEIDLFSLDMDGVDFWIWKALEQVNPRVLILEIQGAWMAQAAVSVPYRPDFSAEWISVGPPGALAQYAGASLPAFVKLGREKGYRLIGANRLSYNVIFLRNDVGKDLFPEVSADSIFSNPIVRAANERALRVMAPLEWVYV